MVRLQFPAHDPRIPLTPCHIMILISVIGGATCSDAELPWRKTVGRLLAEQGVGVVVGGEAG